MNEPERIDRVENKVDGLTERVVSVESKLSDHESQIGRITSHIESEVGLARNELGRIGLQLFGRHEEVNGGKIGDISKRIYKLEMAILSLAGAATIILFLFAAYQFFST